MSDLGFPGSGGGREGGVTICSRSGPEVMCTVLNSLALEQAVGRLFQSRSSNSCVIVSPTQTLRACSQAKMLHFKFSILLSSSFINFTYFILLPVITIIFSINMCYVLYTVY